MWQLQGPFHPETDLELCTPTGQPESLAPSPLFFFLSLPCSVCLFTCLSHLHPRWLFTLSLSPFPSKPPLTVVSSVFLAGPPRKVSNLPFLLTRLSHHLVWPHWDANAPLYPQQILSPCLFLSALPPNHAGILPTCSTLLEPASPAGATVWLAISFLSHHQIIRKKKKRLRMVPKAPCRNW